MQFTPNLIPISVQSLNFSSIQGDRPLRRQLFLLFSFNYLNKEHIFSNHELFSSVSHIGDFSSFSVRLRRSILMCVMFVLYSSTDSEQTQLYTSFRLMESTFLPLSLLGPYFPLISLIFKTFTVFPAKNWNQFCFCFCFLTVNFFFSAAVFVRGCGTPHGRSKPHGDTPSPAKKHAAATSRDFLSPQRKSSRRRRYEREKWICILTHFLICKALT